MNPGTITSLRLSRVVPFVRWWPMVNRSTLKADLVAGFTGSILGLPQGVAFAILAGLPAAIVYLIPRSCAEKDITRARQ